MNCANTTEAFEHSLVLWGLLREGGKDGEGKVGFTTGERRARPDEHALMMLSTIVYYQRKLADDVTKMMMAERFHFGV